jgi:hypothetical protein
MQVSSRKTSNKDLWRPPLLSRCERLVESCTTLELLRHPLEGDMEAIKLLDSAGEVLEYILSTKRGEVKKEVVKKLRIRSGNTS